MAISYLSKVYESNPYVLPVDLGLLEKVNSYKQTLFYKNAESLRSQLGELGSSDILNQQQKDYLNGKVTNLNTQIQQAGGMDFSDMNVVHQIEGFGSDIYNDPTVLNGIVSTKNIRSFNANVEKMQTDPKLSKYYNVSNITRTQEQQIKPYINGDLKATYNGPSAPRPYDGNPFEKMLKSMKNLPPDVVVQTLPNGTQALYNVQTKTFLSDQDISATFDGLIDANTKAQLADDAWYNFDYSTGYKFDKDLGQKLYTDDLLNKKNNYETALSAIDIQLKSNIHPELADKLVEDKANYKNLLDQTNVEITKGNNEFSKLWDKDPDMAKYSLYVGKMRNDVIKAVGYSQEKNNYVKNEEWMFEKRKELEYIKHGLQLNSDGSVTPIPGFGLKKNNKGQIVKDTEPTTGFHQLAYTHLTDEQLKGLEVNEMTINAQKNNLIAENNSATKAIIQDFAQLNDWEKTLGYKTNVNTTGQGPAQTNSSDLITFIQGTDNYLAQNDFADVAEQGINAYKKGLVDENGIDTKTGKAYDYQITHDGRKMGMTHDQLKIITDLQKAWYDFGTGETNNLPDSFKKDNFISKFSEFASKHKQRELVVSANDKYIENVYNQGFSNSKLTEDDKKVYAEWKAAGSPTKNNRTQDWYMADGTTTPNNKYYYVKGTMGKADTPDVQATALGTRIEAIDKKVAPNIKAAFETASKTLNYYSVNLNADNIPSGLVEKISEDRATNNLKTDNKEIQPTSIVRSDDGLSYTVLYNYTKEEGVQKINITPAEAEAFKLHPPSNPELEAIFKYGVPESPEFFVMPNTASTTQKPVFYKIKRQSNEFVPYIVYQGKSYPVTLPESATTASDAEDALKFLATQYKYNSTDEFVNKAINQ